MIAAALTLGACGSDSTTTTDAGDGDPTTSSTSPAEDNQRLWIKADLVDCEGVAPQKCMQVAESADGEYEYFYDQIEGFTFVEGTRYVIDVTVEEVAEPPADGSSLKYTFVETIEEAAGETSAVVESVRWWIGAEQPDCEGVGPQTCLEVATSEDGPSELFYDQIEGFDPEPGTSYVIDVAVESVDDSAADQSAEIYTLVEIIE